MDKLDKYLLALLLTILVEGSVIYLLGFRKSRYMLGVTAINLVTQPTLNYLILVLGYLRVNVTFAMILLLEMLVVVIEWQLFIYIFGGPKVRFLIASALANAASFFAGLLLFWM